MIPSGPTSEDAGPFPTPVQAAGLTLFAALLRGILFLLLVGSFGGRLAFSGIATLLAFGLVFTFAAPRLGNDPARALGFRPASVAAWLSVPFLWAGVLLTSEINNGVIALFPLPEAAVDGPGIAGVLSLLELLAVLVFVLPAVEEIFYRGLLHPGLAQGVGAGRAVLLVALLQGGAAALRLPHLLPEVAATGVLLGVLRQSSGSLLPGLLLAAGFGMTRVLAEVGAFGIPGFDDMTAAHTPLGWLLAAGFSVGIGLALCRRAAHSPRSPDPDPTATR